MVRPVKELKGFQRIWLTAGEQKEISFEITEEMLKYYNNKEEFIFEAGEFEIMIGDNSEQLLKEKIIIQ